MRTVSASDFATLPPPPRKSLQPTPMPPSRTFDRRLAALVNAKAAGALQGGLKGVEKESLRDTQGPDRQDPTPGRWGRR